MATKPCGLYRTTIPRKEIEASSLVYFHNHSDQGPPIVLLPEGNQHNRWTFQKDGMLVEDDKYVASLEALKPEGLYIVTEHFHPDENRVVAKNALVQLGYNRGAEPILFFPTPAKSDNGFTFPSKGMKIPAIIYARLEAVDLRGPHQPRRLH
jgi:hypothetical protein